MVPGCFTTMLCNEKDCQRTVTMIRKSTKNQKQGEKM